MTFDTFRVRKYNRSIYVLNGDLELKEDIGDDVDVNIVAYNFQRGGYDKIGERKFVGICKSLFEEQYRSKYEEAELFSNLKPFGENMHNYVNFLITVL